MRQIGFYFLFILSFVNRDILGMKAEEEMNWEKEFNNNYCISDIYGNILNLSDLEELKLYEDKNGELKTLKEKLNGNTINVVEFCTAKENTIKFKVVEEEEEIKEDVKYFSCTEGPIFNTKELCVGIVEGKILITKEGKLRNFENKINQISKENTIYLVKKPVKESLIFDKAFEAADNAKNPGKTEFEVFLLYSTIRNKIQNQEKLKYDNKIHIFLWGCNKLYYYWDNIKKHIYFFQYYTGAKVFHDEPIYNKLIQTLKNSKKCVVHEMQNKKLLIHNQNVVHEMQNKNQQIPILDPDVEEKKSCCQKCCDNCF